MASLKDETYSAYCFLSKWLATVNIELAAGGIKRIWSSGSSTIKSSTSPWALLINQLELNILMKSIGGSFNGGSVAESSESLLVREIKQKNIPG